ncbi:MAG: cysteine--tRNA ligase, partial [Betaproteobacteria bacterium]|nr:cysteine--tRNA ligase [Betaproteobacteria bacterium]
WMHAAFLNFDSEKMSKSLGNFFTAREVLNKLNPVRGGEEVRFFLLRGHYRSEINYTYETLMDAASTLMGFYRVLKDVPPDDVVLDWSQPHAVRFKAAMEDDFDTPAAFAVLHELKDEARSNNSAQLTGVLKALGGTIGLLQGDPPEFVAGASSDEAIDQLIADRNAAKKAKDFARADAIRKQLDEMGIVLEDKPGGLTEWRRK